MTAATQQTHVQDGNCWHHHDLCALKRAKTVLESRPGLLTVQERDLLAVFRMAILDHGNQPCPTGECFAVARAREFLAAT